MTAHLYGSSGRGFFAFGTSIVATSATVFSLSLGRIFLSHYFDNRDRNIQSLRQFIKLNWLMSFFSIVIVLLYWATSEFTRNTFHFVSIFALSLTSISYIWLTNGLYFFSTIDKQHLQDRAIIISRSLIIFFNVCVLFFSRSYLVEIDVYLVAHCALTLFATIYEMHTLKKHTPAGSKLPFLSNSDLINIVRKDFLTHLENLSIHLYPLFFTLIIAKTMDLKNVGIFNFHIQLLGVVYLVAIVFGGRAVSLRTKPTEPSRNSVSILITKSMALSLIGVVATIVLLEVGFFESVSKDFANQTQNYLIMALSVPGFLLYQIGLPVVLEKKLIGRVAMASLLVMSIFTICTAALATKFGLVASLTMYSLYFLFLPVIQIFCIKLQRKATEV